MPLKSGSSQKTVSSNIKELMHAYKKKGTIGTSKPKSKKKAIKQAAAIAYSKAREATEYYSGMFIIALNERKKNLKSACWKGYTAVGMKKKNGRSVPNCVPIAEAKSPAWQRSEGKDPKGGLNRKGIASYRAANPGSKLSMAVTTKPSKLKKGSKAANRRKSFCARMGGMKKRLTSSKTASDPNSRINKALRKWNC